MSDNLVRDVHDAVAESENPAEASVRLPETTERELRTMQRDVLGKLRLSPWMSVAEIGCGIGLLGVPVAERAARYVGLDFAPRAVSVANQRLRTTGLGDRAGALCIDVLSAANQSLDELGRFDRVLMYAVLHYARSEAEAVRFLRRGADLLAPGGRALIGNLPLEDLRVDWTTPERSTRGLLSRAGGVARWVGTAGTAPIPLTRRWKAHRVGESLLNRRSAVRQFAPARLPPKYTLTLTTTSVERWLATLEGGLEHHWELPSPGVPLAPARADLILLRPE